MRKLYRPRLAALVPILLSSLLLFNAPRVEAQAPVEPVHSADGVFVSPGLVIIRPVLKDSAPAGDKPSDWSSTRNPLESGMVAPPVTRKP